DSSMERVGIVFGLLWIAAPELTLARPKAPQFAGRALSVQAGSRSRRATRIAMRTMRRKASRFYHFNAARCPRIAGRHHGGRSRGPFKICDRLRMRLKNGREKFCNV